MADIPPLVDAPEPGGPDPVEAPSARSGSLGDLDPRRSRTGYLLAAGLPIGTLLGSLALDVGSQIQRPCSAFPESARWMVLGTFILGLVVAGTGALFVLGTRNGAGYARALRGAVAFDVGLLLVAASWLTRPIDICAATRPSSMVLSTAALVAMAASSVMIATADPVPAP